MKRQEKNPLVYLAFFLCSVVILDAAYSTFPLLPHQVMGCRMAMGVNAKSSSLPLLPVHFTLCEGMWVTVFSCFSTVLLCIGQSTRSNCSCAVLHGLQYLAGNLLPFGLLTTGCSFQGMHPRALAWWPSQLQCGGPAYSSSRAPFSGCWMEILSPWGSQDCFSPFARQGEVKGSVLPFLTQAFLCPAVEWLDPSVSGTGPHLQTACRKASICNCCRSLWSLPSL